MGDIHMFLTRLKQTIFFIIMALLLTLTTGCGLLFLGAMEMSSQKQTTNRRKNSAPPASTQLPHINSARVIYVKK